jgi:hypothetical protein
MKTTILLLSTGAVAFILCVLQCYTATNGYAGNLSSVCPNCSLIEEIIGSSIFISVLLLPFAYFVFSQSKTAGRIALMLTAAAYTAYCIWVNYSIFAARETGWSTYRFSEELHFVLVVKVWTALLSAAVFCCLVWLIKNKRKKTIISQ